MSPTSSAESYPVFALNGLRENLGKISARILRDKQLELNDCYEQYRMKINANKTKAMVTGRKVNKINLRILNEAVEQVDSFKYLGCTISSNMSCCQEDKRRVAMEKEAFNIKRSIFCGPLEKEVRKRLVKCFVWSVALHGIANKDITTKKNDAETDQKAEKELAGSLAEKKVPNEGCTRRNGQREKSLGQKMIDDIKICGSYAETKRKAESRKDWRMLGLQRLRWAGHVALMDKSRNAYRVLVGRPEGKRPLGRTRRRWEDNIKMDLREVGYDNRDWINLAQDRDRCRAIQQSLELNGLHQLLVYADDVNMLRENPQTIRENTEILVEASKAIGLEVNPEKIKYMIISRDQNIVRNGNIKIGELSFEEVEKFKYLGTTVTNINDTPEEIKRRINMGNACYYSVEKLSSSSLLSKNLKVIIYKTIILPVVLYGCETWTFTLREEQRLRVFENKVLRKFLRLRGMKLQKNGESYTT
ncbi:hypothetical protein ANN_00551 [Periplaneta americana]|uniref:Reverse transcriptase domain-containing protein n=1 Tax=Periplaneta americana TaxID=6978 RepID=A0ABQ8TR51_PERAM|nr:hypothetical protein ANN_00551 [Periplaneta americana]